MANLPQTGLEAIIANLSNFEAGARTIQKAYDDIERKAGGVEKSTGSLSSALSSLGSPLSSLGGQFTSLGDSILKIGTIAGGAALAGITAFGAGLATVVATSTMKAADLDQKLANIASTMGVTKEAVTPLKEEILNLALDPKLTVTATQAADAIELLAQNGIPMQEILDGAARSTVALANATGAQFNTAATIASSVMQQFGIDAKDMEKAIDGITGVTVSSKFNIDDYGQAISQVGGFAAGIGISLEDVNTVLSATSANFTSGSDAGTSFKAMLQRLSNPTDEMKVAMDKYGISLFDAEGKMRPLSEVAQQLHDVFQGQATITETVGGATKEMAAAAERAGKAIPKLTTDIGEQENRLKFLNDEMGAIVYHYGEGSLRARNQQLRIDELTNSINENKGKLGEYQTAISGVSSAQAKTITSTVELTEAQKAELATVIGGADGARTILGLSKLTEDQFNSTSAAVNKQGQAFEAAATRVDSFKGALDIFKGIIEATQIQIGDKFLPILKQVTVNFSRLATKIGPKIVDFFGGIANLIPALIDKGTQLFDTFGDKGLAGVFASLGVGGGALFFKKLSTLFQLITGDAGTLGETIQSTLGTAFEWLTTNIFPILSTGVQFIIDHFEEFKGALFGIGAILAGGVFAAIVAGVLSLLTPINLIIAGAALLGAAWAGNWGGIQEKTFAAWAVIQPVLQQLITWLQTNIPIAIQATADFWTTTLQPALQATGDFIMTTVVPALSQIWTWLQTNLPVAIQFLSDVWTNVLQPALSTFGDYLMNTMIPNFMLVAEWVGTNLISDAQSMAKTWNDTLLPAITGIWEFINTSLLPLFRSIGNFLSAVLNKAIQASAGLWQNVLSPALVEVGDYLSETFSPAFDAIAKVIGEKVKPALDTMGGTVLPKFQTGLEAVKKIIKEVTDFFNSLASAVRNFELPPVLTPGSPTPFEEALRGIANAANMAGSALGNMTVSQAAIDRLLGVTRIADPIREAIGAARDDVEKFFDSMKIEGSKSDLTLSILTQAFRENSAEILGATDRVAAFQAVLGRTGVNFERIFAGGSSNPFAGKGGGAVSVFLTNFDKRFEEMEKAARDMFIRAGRTAVTIGNQLNNMAASLIDPMAEHLNDTVSTLTELIQGAAAAGAERISFEGQIINATQAQEMLNQALAKQRDIQDELTKLRENEMKLGFLEKQLTLMETLQKAGIDIDSVLGGLKLGIDASIPDIVAATNKLVEAMIAQMDEDLQIGSPSKVAVDKAKNFGLSFAEGIKAQGSAIMSAIQGAISAPLIAAPALGAGSATTNVYNINNGGNTINSGMDEATFDARVRQSLQRMMGT